MHDEDELASIWGGVKENLRRQLGQNDYELWIARTRLAELTEAAARVEATDDLHAAFLDSNYLANIQNALEVSLGTRRPVIFCAGNAEATYEQPEFFPELVVENAGDKQPYGPKRLRPTVGLLREDHSFENFVVGSNMEFAAAACVAVAKNPGRTYNPLFLFGGSGLGKTHLLHAIGREIMITRPKARVVCITSEEFTNEFIAAIGNSSLVQFRKKYRTADVLLIDDVQFFGNKGRTQEEFFHTFNQFHNDCKQIVLTCDSMPAEIEGLEKRLMSRFEWGMTASLASPDLETRVAILRKRLQALKGAPYLTDEIIRFVAEKVRTNVRRLQGAILRVVSYVAFDPSRPLTIEIVANEVLADIIHEEAKETVTIALIQKATADYFELRVADLTGKARPANVAWARQVAMYLCRTLTKAPYQEIGSAFGDRDHGTVMHAVRKVEEKINTDPKATSQVKHLMRILQK